MSYPLIFDSSATDFRSQGYGALSDVTHCKVTENLNGSYELEMRYPVQGLHSEYIKINNLIVCNPNRTVIRQAFRIYEITEEITGMATIHARHISYDLNGYPVEPFTATSLSEALTGLLSGPITPPFSIDADFSAAANFKVGVPSSVRSWFGGREGSIIDIFGGEWEYDNFNCYLRAHRGTDNGVRVQYGKNITRYDKDVKSDGMYSQLCAYWYDEETETLVQGNYIDTGISEVTRVKFFDLSMDFEEAPTVADLDAYATGKISEYNSAALSVAVGVIPLDNIRDSIELGDTVHVYYRNDAYTTRCVTVVWNVLTDMYESISVGALKTSLAQTINDQTAQSGYTTRRDVAAMIQKASPVRVIESGVDNGWQYKKFSDGTYEAFKRLELSGVACDIAWGSLYVCTAQNFGARPSFDALGMEIQVSYVGLENNSRGWAANWGRIAGATYPTGTWVVVCPVSQASIGGHLSAVLHGFYA